MRLYGLIGYPLAQSFSKKYFTEKFESEGLTDCRFENFELASLATFREDVITPHPDLSGLAVTIPYKQAIIPFLDSTENLPPGLHACNCIQVKNGKLIGFNTDHIGFQKSLAPLLQPHHSKALVLGNGGATAAVIYALKNLHIGFSIVSRSLHHGSTCTYADLSRKVMEEHPVIINTTPLGMYPDSNSFPPIPYEWISDRHLLYDLVYNPEKTVFLQHGEAKGAIIKNGADMLVLQAEENWKIWNAS